MIKNEIKEIYVPAEHNPFLQDILTKINNNEEIHALWNVINTNAIERLGMTDHGITHVQIVSNIALKMARMLIKSGVDLSVKKNMELTNEHGEVVILLASLMHDLGMSVHRKGHEEFSIVVVNTLLRDVLSDLPVQERVILTSEVLHAIIGHRKEGSPYTLEAGIVRVADALDMSSGRAKSTIEAENFDIHSISHEAIEKIDILKGDSVPIHIDVTMKNPAGLFQVDELLKNKIKGSGLEKYVEVKIRFNENSEDSVINEMNLKF